MDYTKSITSGPLAAGFDYYNGNDVPNFPPSTFIKNEKVEVLPTVEKPKGLFGHAGAYGDFVQEVDWTVGQVMEMLEQKGIAEYTLVIFTSDNGPPARNGENFSGPVASAIEDYGHRANGQWRGFKGDAWEGGHRVPFMVKWPGHVAPGEWNDGLVSSLDIMGMQPKLDVSPDGVSLKSTLENSNETAREYLVHHSHRGVFAIRKGDWKLILSQKSGGFSDGLHPDGYNIYAPGQLYNMKEDSSELDNLYVEHREKVRELEHLLDEIKQ